MQKISICRVPGEKTVGNPKVIALVLTLKQSGSNSYNNNNFYSAFQK